jgi:hypothetical protein
MGSNPILAAHVHVRRRRRSRPQRGRCGPGPGAGPGRAPGTSPPAASPPDQVEAEAIRSENVGMAALAAGRAEEAAAAFARAIDYWRQLGLTVWQGEPSPCRRSRPVTPAPGPPPTTSSPGPARSWAGRKRPRPPGVHCPAEAWPSGRRHTPGKRVGGQLPRGFEPLSLRRMPWMACRGQGRRAGARCQVTRASGDRRHCPTRADPSR